MRTILKGKSKDVTIGIDRPFVMIGEKINPTGNKKLAAALAAMAEGVSFDSVGFVDQSEYVHSISPNPGD